MSSDNVDSYILYGYLMEYDTEEWHSLTAQLGLWGGITPLVVCVRQCWELGGSAAYHILEKVGLLYGDDSIPIRWRVFKYDSVATRNIVPPLSEKYPARPYAEITWSNGSVAGLQIFGLENLAKRGRSISKESASLSKAVDAVLGLEVHQPENSVRAEVTISKEEQIWRSQACPAAKAIGRRNADRLTQEVLAEELRNSPGTVKNRKRDFPESWPLIEAAFNEGKQEYAAEQMSKPAK